MEEVAGQATANSNWSASELCKERENVGPMPATGAQMEIGDQDPSALLHVDCTLGPFGIMSILAGASAQANRHRIARR